MISDIFSLRPGSISDSKDDNNSSKDGQPQFMIELIHFSKSYGRFQAVNGLNFKASQGELVGFIGPNGAGKTTTFKCLTTLSKPTSGTILIDGLDTSKNASLVRERIGYLPEENPLINELKVQEYLEFRFRLKGGKGRSPSQCLEICGLEEARKKVIGHLSKGFRQRVGIAEAMLGGPKVLLLDEPINGLDPEQIINIRNLLVSLKKEHTLVVSSHILSELELICDKYLIISKGVLKSSGTREEILARSALKNQIVLEAQAEKPEQILSGIRNLEGIESAEFGGRDGKTFLIRICENTGEVRPALNRLLREQNASILKLDLISPKLETLYMELTGE